MNYGRVDVVIGVLEMEHARCGISDSFATDGESNINAQGLERM